jgi:hypothetical protein
MPTLAANQGIFSPSNENRTIIVSVSDGSIITDSIVLTGHLYSAMNQGGVWAHYFPFTAGQPAKIRIIDANFNIVATTDMYIASDRFVHTAPVAAAWGSGKFYMARDGRKTPTPVVTKIREVTDAGVAGTTWSLPQKTISGLAVNNTGTIAYYSEDSDSSIGTYPNSSPIHRYDLSGAAPLSDLVAGGVADEGYGVCWFIHPVSGDLFVTYSTDLPSFTDWEVRRIDVNTGATLGTYIVGDTNGSDLQIAIDLTDPSKFWTWSGVAGDMTFHQGIARKWDIASATVVASWTVAGGTGVGKVPDPFANGSFFMQSVFTPTPPTTPNPIIVGANPDCCATNNPTSTVLPPVSPVWAPSCEGGGVVPTAPDLTLAELWDY